MSSCARITAALTAGAILCALTLYPLASQAQTAAPTAAEIQALIDAQNAQILELDKEIAQYEKELDAVGSKKQTLQNELSKLNLSLKRSAASIAASKKKISSTQLQIQQLAQGIAVKQDSIEMDEAEASSLALQILASGDLAETWRELDSHQSLQEAVTGQMQKLSQEKQSLSEVKSKTEAKRAELLAQQRALLAEQGTLNATKKAQSELLAQTKSQESTYQKILAEKIAGKAASEAALNDLKAQYLQNVDPSQIPAARKGVFRWPLDKYRITQTFGLSSFALSGAYNGKGHNGIDLGAPTGAPVKAVLSGTVIGTGNTDAYRGCYSAGKWIMVKHLNGLSTLY